MLQIYFLQHFFVQKKKSCIILYNNMGFGMDFDLKRRSKMMKIKLIVILATLAAATTFGSSTSTTTQNTNNTPNVSGQAVVNQQQGNGSGNSTRGINTRNTTNWSKIKDMFM